MQINTDRYAIAVVYIIFAERKSLNINVKPNVMRFKLHSHAKAFIRTRYIFLVDVISWHSPI